MDASLGRGGGTVAVNLRIDQRSFAPIVALARKYPAEAAKAKARAINETLRFARTRVTDAVYGVLNVKRADITKTMKLRQAHAANASGELSLTGRRIALSKFGAKQAGTTITSGVTIEGGKRVRRATGVTRTRPGRVTYHIQRNAGRSVLAHGAGASAFLGMGRRGGRGTSDGVGELGTSGHVGVFARKGKSRLPLLEFYGPSIPQVAIGSREVRRALETDVSAYLLKRVNHNIDFVMRGIANG